MSRFTADPGLLAIGVACFAAAIAVAVYGVRYGQRTRPQTVPFTVRHERPAPPRPVPHSPPPALSPPPRPVLGVPRVAPTPACGFSAVEPQIAGLWAGVEAAKAMCRSYEADTPVWPPRQEMPR